MLQRQTFRSYRTSAALALLLVAGAPRGALAADTDPLRGYCAGAGQCVSNGTNSPTSNNPPQNFGFTVTSGGTGDLVVDLLIPNTIANSQSLGLTITGDLSGDATLFSSSAWTSGRLENYLGIDASPNNPIRAFLPSTQALDPGATGFYVFQADLGGVTLRNHAHPNIFPLLNTDVLPLGSYVVGFFDEGGASWIATRDAGAIFVTAPGPVPGEGLAGLAFLVLAGAWARALGFFAR